MSLFESQYDQPLILPLQKPKLPPPAPLPTDRPGSYHDRVMRPGARQSTNIEDQRQPLSDPADIAAAQEYARVIGKGPDDTARFNLATGVASWATGRTWEDQKALARTLVTRLNSPGRSPRMRHRIDGGPPDPVTTVVAQPQASGIKPVELNPQTQPPLRPTQPVDPIGFAPTDSVIGNHTDVMRRGPDTPVAQPQRRVWTPEEAADNNRAQREQITEVMAGRRRAEAADEQARRNRGFARPPQTGQVIDGYRYLGGDPRNQANWQWQGGV